MNDTIEITKSSATEAVSKRLLSTRRSMEELGNFKTSFKNTDSALIANSTTEVVQCRVVNNENLKKSHSTKTFVSLDEEGETYLKEHMGLPPIGDLSMTKYYINLHPTSSEISSSRNSVSEWWNFLDYDDQNTTVINREEGRVQNEIAIQYPNLQQLHKTFPLTEEKLKNKKLRQKEEFNQNRARAILDLEKQMVSLYNLKRQYQKNLQENSCQKMQMISTLPGDQLTRHRDSMVNKIRRKKIEDDVRKRKQIERKMNIVKKLLKEQQWIKDKCELSLQKENEPKCNKHHRIKKTETHVEFQMKGSIHKDDSLAVVDDFQTQIDVETEYLSSELKRSDAPLETSILPKNETIANHSPRKASNKGGLKKSIKHSKIENEKPAEKKKKKITGEFEVPAATCEQLPELPTSQAADLLLWFENWRGQQDEKNIRLNELKAQQLSVENNVEVKPAKVIFKDVKEKQVRKQQVTVTNLGQAVLQCRVARVTLWEVTEKSPSLKAVLKGPSKARTGNFWTLHLLLETFEAVEDTKAEVLLQFCRPDCSTTRLTLGVDVLTPCAEPSLSTFCIRFGSQVYWTSGHITRYVQITNCGSLACTVRWERELSSEDAIPNTLTTESETNDVTSQWGSSWKNVPESGQIVVKEMIQLVLKNVFDVFRIDARPRTVSPKSHVTLPVKFIPSMTSNKGDVFSKYKFVFEGERVKDAVQELVVCGYIEDSAFTVEPAVLDMQLCFVGGSVQQGQFQVHSSARHVCAVSARVPRTLAQDVAVVPRDTLVQACSTVTLAVRVALRWSFYDDHCSFFDAESGLLSFPVLIGVQCSGTPPAPPLELTVMALVAHPCPLSLDPDYLNLGQVSTQETVFTDISLTNHNHFCSYTYAFIDLPESVIIEPGGGHGVILPGETLPLHLLYSPSVRDLGVQCEQPGAEGSMLFILRCFTTISLASPSDKTNAITFQSENQKGIDVSCKFSENPITVKNPSRGESIFLTSCSPSTLKNMKEEEINEASKDSRVSGANEIIAEDILSASNASSLSINSMETGSLRTQESNTQMFWDYRIVDQLTNYHSGGLYEETDEQGSLIFHDRTMNGKDNTKLSTDIEEEIKKKKDDVKHSHGFEELKKKSEFSTKGQFCKDNRENISIKQEPTITKYSEENVKTGIVQVKQKNHEFSMVPDSLQSYASITLQGYLVDSLVELSSQAVILPPTPCNSYSLAHLYIRTKDQKKCSVHGRSKNFKTWFKFESPCKQLTVLPEEGYLTYKQSIKVTIIFKPTLSQQEVLDKALEMKIERIKRDKVNEMLEQYYKSKEKKEQKRYRAFSVKENSVAGSKKKNGGTSKKLQTNNTETEKPKKKTKSKGSVVSYKTKKTKLSLKSSKVKKKDSGPLPEVVVNPNEVEVTEDDEINAKLWLLKYFEPMTTRATVSCVMVTEMDSGTRRHESLDCSVVCPVVAPTIALNSAPSLEFGPTCVGTQRKQRAVITNLSFFDAFVTISTLNPVGPFTCPVDLEVPLKMGGGGVELPPEHILDIPIVFQPSKTSEQVKEMFQVTSGRTVLHLQARGESVTPSFKFSPDLEVFNLSCASGKKADVSISISNTCRATLSFHIKQLYLKEGLSLPTKPPSPPPSPGSGIKGKPKSKNEKKGKAVQEFYQFTPELKHCLENDFCNTLNGSPNDPLFKIIEGKERIDVLSGESKTVTIRFSPPQTNENLELQNDEQMKDKKESKSKGGLKKGEYKINKENNEETDLSELNIKNTNISKQNKKEKLDKSISGKSTGRGKTDIGKRIIASKYTIGLANLIVKEWIFLGTIKK